MADKKEEPNADFLPVYQEIENTTNGFTIILNFYWQFHVLPFNFAKQLSSSVFVSKFRTVTLLWKITGHFEKTDEGKSQTVKLRSVILKLHRSCVPKLSIRSSLCSISNDSVFCKRLCTVTNRVLQPYGLDQLYFQLTDGILAKNLLVRIFVKLDGRSIFPECPFTDGRLLQRQRFEYEDDVVTLISNDGDETSIPKEVLTSRSPVFKAMFQSGMRESNSNVLNLDDLDSASVRALKEYLCDDKLPPSTPVLVQLVKTGEKYDLPDLKCESSLALSDHFSGGKVLQFLSLATMYRSPQLSSMVAMYLNKIWKDRNKKEWEEFVCELSGDFNCLE